MGIAARLGSGELVVLQLTARGYTAEQIAMMLDMSRQEVDALVQSACRQLGTFSVREAVAIALTEGVIV